METTSGDGREVRGFPSEPTSPVEARHFAASTVRGWGQGELADMVALVVSELASNAVLHAHSPFDVTVSQLPGGVRVAVRDRSNEPPMVVSAPGDLGETGRGLALVSAVAERWGHEPVGGGKEVWAELSD